MHVSRRAFLARSGRALAAAGLAAGVPAPFAAAAARSVAPSDTVSVGLIGCRSMGFGDLKNVLAQPGVVCGGLGDVDAAVLEERAAEVERLTGRRPKLHRDFRQLLDDPEVDAVIIGTPDHWHCLQTVYACEAGKDVYVEKPMANTIAESALMVQAARRYGRVVQVGQQQRSGAHWQDVVGLVRSGRLGTLRQVRLWANFAYGAGQPRVPDGPAPAGVDYDLWLGPAPQRAFNPNRFHSAWRFVWDYGGGLMTDWGAHLLDIPLWALQIDGPPRSVSAVGGIFAYPDHHIETPDTLAVVYEMDGFNMVWEHHGGLQSGPYGRHYGVAFVGGNATLVVNRNGWELLPEKREDRPLVEAIPLQEGIPSNHAAHAADFVARIRDRGEPVCPVEAGYRAALYSHLGNIAHRTGSRLVWDAGAHRFEGNEAANALVAPTYRAPWKLPVV